MLFLTIIKPFSYRRSRFFAIVTSPYQSKETTPLKRLNPSTLKATTLFIVFATLMAASSITFAEYDCPEGTKKQGLSPPKGYQVKCVNSNGKRNGPFWMWYRNGQMMQAFSFKNGKEHGRQEAWFPNGNVMMKGVSIDGARNKGFKYFNYFGEPVALEFKKNESKAPE